MSLICASQHHFHYNMCVSSTGLAQFQACEFVRRGRQGLIRALLPHTMVPQFVPYYINFYDTTGTEQGYILTKSITIFNPLSLKDLQYSAENQPVFTNRSAWHTEVTWNAEHGMSDNRHVIMLQSHAWCSANHNHTQPINELFHGERIMHQALCIHRRGVNENHGFRASYEPSLFEVLFPPLEFHHV